MTEHQRWRDYLLGRAPEPIDDPDGLEVVESTLIDEYVLGTLSGADRVDFETYYLTTEERRAQVLLARKIFQHDRQDRWRRVALTALPLLVAALALVWAWKSSRPQLAPDLILAQNAHRGATVPPVRLSTLGPTLRVELHLSTVSQGPIDVRVLRIGLAEPSLQLRLPDAPLVFTLPIPREALEPGDYSITIEAGASYRQDFVFQLEP